MTTFLISGLPLEMLRSIQQSTVFTQFEITFQRVFSGFLTGSAITLIIMLSGWLAQKEIISPIEVLYWSQEKARSKFTGWSRMGMIRGSIIGFIPGIPMLIEVLQPGLLRLIGFRENLIELKVEACTPSLENGEKSGEL